MPRYANVELKMTSNSRSCELIRTDLQMQIPENHHGKIFGRSELALNFGLTVQIDIIDSDFRGVVCIVVFNNSYNNYKIAWC